MLIHQDHIDSTDRVIWRGGESTQLHYEILISNSEGISTWVPRSTRTFNSGIPCDMDEVYAAMIGYYYWCQDMERDSLLDTL